MAFVNHAIGAADMKKSTRDYILNPFNLRRAVLKLYMAKSKRQREKQEVQDVMNNLLNWVCITSEELRNGTYKVGDYRHFVIHDKKDRNISVLPYKDRCVQSLVKDAIEPVILKKITDDMYGGLPGRGIVTKNHNRSVTRRMRRIVTSGRYSSYWMGDIEKVRYSTAASQLVAHIESEDIPIRDLYIDHDWRGLYYRGTVYSDQEEADMLRAEFGIDY